MVNVTEEIIKSTADKFIAMLEESKGKGKWIKPFFGSANAPISAGRSEKSNLIKPGMIGMTISKY